MWEEQQEKKTDGNLTQMKCGKDILCVFLAHISLFRIGDDMRGHPKTYYITVTGTLESSQEGRYFLRSFGADYEFVMSLRIDCSKKNNCCFHSHRIYGVFTVPTFTIKINHSCRYSKYPYIDPVVS